MQSVTSPSGTSHSNGDLGPRALAKLIAFYLPQYHPIPENDAWWGKGFTEWTNVTRARPLFPGHHQPHLPADLGFYDLRLPEVREQQAELAQQAGIYGFCYYHYWFNGHRLLNRPFDDVLASGQPRMPFCLCWANENWTRTWDGREHQVLIAQNYNDEDDRRHMRWLAGAFRDDRYIRYHGKPLFMVYRAQRLPDPRRTTEIWRNEAMRLGIGEIFLAKVESMWDEHGDPRAMGFDAAVEFQPDMTRLGLVMPMSKWGYRADRMLMKGYARLHRAGQVYDYPTTVKRMLRPRPLPYQCFPCVTPSWDNTARRRNRATVFKNASPAVYEDWLTEVVRRSAIGDPDNLVFVNAWNEWAEGNHLEPCQRWGHAYLDATRHALERSTELVKAHPDAYPAAGELEMSGHLAAQTEQ